VLVALDRDRQSGDETTVAVGRLNKLPDPGRARVALVVRDDFQGFGLGTELVSQLVQAARDQKIAQIEAEMLRDCTRAQRVLKKAGFRLLAMTGVVSIARFDQESPTNRPLTFPIRCHMLRHMRRRTEKVAERHVRVFKNGRNQAVRIPREFELPGEDAIMRKEGARLIIEPAPPKSLLALLATLAPLSEDFPPIRDLPPDPVDL